MENVIHDAEWYAKRKELMQRYRTWKTWKKQRMAELKASLIESYKEEYGVEPKNVEVW